MPEIEMLSVSVFIMAVMIPSTTRLALRVKQSGTGKKSARLLVHHSWHANSRLGNPRHQGYPGQTANPRVSTILLLLMTSADSCPRHQAHNCIFKDHETPETLNSKPQRRKTDFRQHSPGILGAPTPKPQSPSIPYQHTLHPPLQKRKHVHVYTFSHSLSLHIFLSVYLHISVRMCM